MAQDPSFSVVEADRRAEEQYRRAAQPAAYSALAQAATTSPEAAALRQRAAEVLGTIPAAIQDDPDAVTRARVQQDMGRLPAHPVTMNWLANPDNAAVAHDQVESLTAMEALLARPAPASQNPFDRLNQDAASFLGRPGVAPPTPAFRTRAPRVGLGTRLARYGLNPTANVGELFAAAGDLGRDFMAGVGQPLASTVEGAGVEAQLTGGSANPLRALMDLARPGGLSNPAAHIGLGRYLAEEVLISLGLGDVVQEMRGRVRETGVGIEAAGKSMQIGTRNWRGTLTDDDIQQIIASGNSDRILPDRQTETGLTGDVVQGVGQVGGTVLISTATRGTLTMPSLYLQGVGQMNTRVEADMAQDGRTEYSERDARALRAGGAFTAISERLGLDAILGKLPKPIQDRIKSRLADILVAGFGEGASEVAEGVGQNAAAMALLDEDAGLFDGTVEGGTVGALVGSIAKLIVLTATPGRQYTEDQARAEAAEPAAQRLDNLVDMVARNTLLNRTPERLRNFLTGLSGDESVYLPAEAAITFFQSTPEAEALIDELDIRDQYEAAQIGDTPIAVPKAAYLMAAAKNPDLHAAMRGVLQDGLGAASIAEAEEFKKNGAAKLAEEMDAAIAKAEQDDAADSPVRVLEAELFSQLRANGYTVDAARLQASYMANLYRVEAANNPARYADARAAYQAYPVNFGSEFAQNLSQSGRADAVIEAFVRGRTKPAASLAEFVSQDGGVFDPGGQLTAMGADRWHTGKVGKGRLVVPDTFSATGPMPADLAERQPERVLARAVAAGYLPEGSTVDDLMAALKADVKGGKGKKAAPAAPAFDTSAPENAQALADLEALLGELDIDQDTATAEEIRAAIDRAARAPDASPAQVFEQSKAATRALAQDYKSLMGIDRPDFIGPVQPVLEDMVEIADAFEAAVHAPEDPEVLKSYGAMIGETIAMYQSLEGLKIEAWRGEGQPYADSKAMLADVRDNGHFWFFLTDQGFGPTLINIGLKVSTDEGGGDLSMEEVEAALAEAGISVIQQTIHPSATEPTLVAVIKEPLSPEALGALSVRLRQDAIPQLAGNVGTMEGPRPDKFDGGFNPDYFLTMSGQSATTALKHPLLAKTGIKLEDGTELVANDVFRVVHDIFGHGQQGFGFGPVGELNAYREHETMYSPEARPAVAAETAMQNAWVNFGPHLRREDGSLPVRGEPDYVPLADRRFADQKAFIATPEVLKLLDRAKAKAAPQEATAGRFIPPDLRHGDVQVFPARDGTFLHIQQTGADAFEYSVNTDPAPGRQVSGMVGFINSTQLGDVFSQAGATPTDTKTLNQADSTAAPLLQRPPVNPDGTITLTHYSVETDLTETDPTKWGRSGNFLPRSERSMISTHLPRTYFGIGVGQPGGYRPEFATRTAYTTDIDASRLYDAAADPDGFRDNLEGVDQFNRINAIERQIAEKYDGYWLKNELGMTATLFRPVAVRKPGVTDSPAFRAWFGKSKAVDENGQPLAVYHATNNDFDAFNDGITFFGSTGFASIYAKIRFGYWKNVMTPWEKDLMIPTGVNIMPAFVRSERPLDTRTGLPGLQMLLEDEHAEWLAAATGGDAQTLRAAATGPRAGRDPIVADLLRSPEGVAAIRAAGFDGVLAIEGGEEVWAVFDPTQIKSAIANRGTFDPNDARILYQTGVPDEHPDRISTRLPTTKGAKEDAVANKLTVSTEAMGKKPSVLEHNAKLVSSYPGVRIKARSAQGRARAFIDHVKANLLALFDRVPAETRERSKQWYDGARALTTVWAGRYGLPDRSVAAVIAALSPQKDWYQNVSLAERVLDVWSKRQDYVYDEAMEAKGAELFAKYPDLLAKLRGKSLAELEHLTEKAAFVRIYDQAHNPRGFRIASPEGQFLGEPGGNVAWGSLVEVAKAVSVLEGQSFENVSFSLGDRHKVRNFYNNIISPRSSEGDVTIDTHAVAAGLLRALSGSDAEVFHNFGSSPMAAKQPPGWVAAKNANEFGVSGTYGFYADAYREAAAERGVSAREMQSITWEAVRGLFGAKFKSNKKNVKAVNDLWLAHSKGDASLEETINAVIEYAGGIAQPSWDGPGAGLAVAERQASYDGELSRAGLPGRDAGRGADGQPAGDADPVARVFFQSEPAQPAPPFFSALTRAVENEGPERATAAEWKRWLIEPESVKRGVVRDKATNKPMVDAEGNPVISETVIPAKPRAGVKMDEIFWTGTGTWLDALADPDELSQTFAREAGQIDADGNISRQTFLDFLKAGGLRVDEVVLGDFDQAAVDARVEEILDEKVDEAFADWDGGSVYVGEITDDEGGEITGWGLFADGRLISEDFYDSEEAAQEAADETNQEEEADSIRRIRNDWRSSAIDQAEREGAGGEQAKFADWATKGAEGSYREVLFRLPGIDGPATHWDDDNVVAHARLTERKDADGNRVLFIEEVQSDWHQKGRDQGYMVQPDPVAIEAARTALTEAGVALDAAGLALVGGVKAELQASIDGMVEALENPVSDSLRRVLSDSLNELKDAAVRLERGIRFDADGGGDVAYKIFGRSLSGGLMMTRPPELAALHDAAAAARLRHVEARQALDRAQSVKGIPDAPFRTSWPALVMKRMIRWAVDHGYEKVAWTTGDQQSKRYNLSSATGPLSVQRDVEAEADSPAYDVEMAGTAVTQLTNNNLGSPLNAYRSGRNTIRMTPAQMKEAFGADIAGRLIALADAAPGFQTLEGEGLDVGGEGMRAFYDRNLVNITNDIVKRYGVKVGMIDMNSAAMARHREVSAEAIAVFGELMVANAALDAELARGADTDYRKADRITADIVRLSEREKRLKAQQRDLAAQIGTGDKFFGDQPGFTITPALRDAAMSGFALFQKKDAEPRAQIAFSKAGAFITLFKKRDLTSIFHELGHLSLERLIANASGPDASEKSKRDLQIALDYLNVRDPADIGEPQHELWAQTQERYLMEGKAPSLELRGTFRTIKSWFISVYGSLSHPQVNVPITDEVRGVFDRMMATDAEIEAARAQLKIEAGFTDAAEAGMSEQQWADYQRLVERARTDSEDELLKKVTAAIRRERTAEWKAEAAELRPEVAAEIDELPAIKAMNWLRDNKASLNREDVAAMLGDAAASLPKTVPPITSKKGLHPDNIAEVSGHGSGAELLADLIAVEAERQEMLAAGDGRSVRTKRIDDEVTARLRELHGDPFTDGSIEAEAMAAVHNDKQAEVLHLEMSIATRRVGGAPAPIAALREWAAEKIGSRPVSEARPAKYLRAERKAANAAQKAAASRDFKEFARQKQAQTLNHLLYSEARKAEEYVEKTVRRLKKLDKARTIKSMDQEYLEQIHGLLEAYDLREVSGRQLAKRQGLLEFVTAQEALGNEIVVPQALLEMASRQHYSALTVDELKALDDTIKSLVQLGRLKQTLLDNRERRDFMAVVKEFLGATADMKSRRGMEQRNREDNSLRQFDASMWKVETLADWLDRDDVNGVMNRILIRPAVDAANREDQLHESVGRLIRESYLAVPRAIKKKWMDKVVTPELIDEKTGKPSVFVRKDLLAMALNVGNASNLDKLTRGENWTEGDVMTVLNRELSVEEWQMVQGVWDAIETLWPEIARVERILSGVEPERVTPMTIQTSAGELRGGYYPVVYDPQRRANAEAWAQLEANDLFNGVLTGAATPKGHTKERPNYAGPILPSVEGVLFGHLNKVIKRIAYAEYVTSARKFIVDDKVREAITTKVGPEYYALLMPWLQAQVTDRGGNNRDLVGMEKFFKRTRLNFQMVAMGLRVTTGLAQIAGFTQSAALVGKRQLAAEISRYALGIRMGRNDLADFVFVRSEEMRQRMQNRDRDLRDALRELQGKTGVVSEVQRAAFIHIGIMDQFVSVPTWMAAYKGAIKGGLSEDDAIATADKAVRRTQGSGRELSLSAIQRPNSEGAKLFTLFYSYFNVQYNRQRDIARYATTGDPAKAISMAFWIMIAAPVLGSLLVGDWPDEDDGEGWQGWMSWMGRKVFFNLFSGIVGVRDLASYAERKVGGEFATYSATPITGVGSALEDSVKDLSDLAAGEDVSDRWLKHTIQTPGYLIGLPTGQIASSSQYIYDVFNGDQEPEHVGEFLFGLMKGPQKDQE